MMRTTQHWAITVLNWNLEMATLRIYLPENLHTRLKALAARKRVSINKLMEELSTQAVAEFDAETRFRAMAARGDATRGMALLDKLDTSPS